MDARVDSCVLAERIIVIHKLATSLFVQTRFRERHYQKTLDDLEDVAEGPLGGVPVALQRVHADFARVHRHVRVENLRQEVPFGGALRELTFNDELASEDASLVRCLHFSQKKGKNQGIQGNSDTYLAR